MADEKDKDKLKVFMAMDEYLPDVDGVVNCMHNYCMHSLDRAKVTAIVPKNKKDYVDKEPYEIIRCASIKVPVLKAYYGFPDTDAKFQKIVNEKDFDIIHLHSPFNMGKYCLKLARKKGKPIVATFHTNFRPIFEQLIKVESVVEAVVKSIGNFYNKLDEIFVCSPVVEEQARSFGYKGKVTYLPFGTEYEKADNVEELKARFNAAHNTSPDDIVFLYVGRLMELKRIDYILDSLKILKDKGIKFKFYIVGKGMVEESLKKHAKSLGLEEETVFTGFVTREELSECYARADLFLFPSLYDNFGLVKVEAAAFSTAGVFIKDSATAYGVTDDVDGFLSEDSREAFADKIIYALQDREKLEKVGKQAAENLYCSWQQATDKVMDRLEEIARNYQPKKTTTSTAETKSQRVMKNAVYFKNNENVYNAKKKLKEKLDTKKENKNNERDD